MLTNLRETVTGNVVEVPASAPAVSFVVSWLTSGATGEIAPPTSDAELFVSVVRLADFLQIDQLYGWLLSSLRGLSLLRACYAGVPNLTDLLCSSPMSTKITGKTLTMLPSSAGTYSPACAISVSIQGIR